MFVTVMLVCRCVFVCAHTEQYMSAVCRAGAYEPVFCSGVCMSVLLLAFVSRDVQLIRLQIQLPFMLNRFVVAAETAEGSQIETD